MIQFWSAEYTLLPKQSMSAAAGSRPRKGALLKMQWPDTKIGYADLFPWPELGDLPLSEQLLSLRKGHLTPLIEQAIWLGRKDAVLRAAQKNGLDEIPKVRNHFTIPDFEAVDNKILNDAKALGFNTLKVKVGRDWKAETKWLSGVLRDFSFGVRLDFNSQSDFSTFERMISSLAPGLKQKLEYAEDPFPFDHDSWTEANKILPLALDMEFDKVEWKYNNAEVPFKTIVIKPARQDVDKALKIADEYKLRIVVSSSMDHPVGVIHAVRLAGEIKSKVGSRLADCGCLTMRLYEDSPYTHQVIVQGPFLTKISGTGIGFDSLLAKQNWTALSIDAG
jgi:O-succinylbenzoate synthase